MNKKLIVGNWKMNPGTLGEAKIIARKVRRIADGLSSVETVICPPYVFVCGCSGRSQSRLRLGAQDVSQEYGGAHTGEVGANMLRDIGVKYVLVGHSERRKIGDTDEIVSKKLVLSINAGLIPILCVGEEIRDEGGAYLETLKKQIKESLFGIAKKYAGTIIMAYEPVWAIGAKQAMISSQICEMAIFVKKVFADVFGAEAGMKVKVLYGGSVNKNNADDIIRAGKVDGLLVGRDSIDVSSFSELLKIVDRI